MGKVGIHQRESRQASLLGANPTALVSVRSMDIPIILPLAGLWFGRGTELYAVKSAHGGPRDGAILKLHSDAIAVIRHPLTINDVPANRFFVHGSYQYLVIRLQRLLGEYASAMCTDVIGVRSLLSVGTRTSCHREAYYQNDRKPPFHPATDCLVQ